MQDEPHAAPGGTDRAERRQTKTAWRARRRYRLAQWLLAALGLAVALALVAASVAALPDPHDALAPHFLVQAVAIVAAGAVLPWAVVGWLWRRARRRSFWDWQ